MEKIEFQEVIKICNDFIHNPSNEHLKKLEDLKAKLTIRTYLPMQEKVIILYKVTMDADKSTELATSVFSAGLELSFCFNALLAYTNINANIPKEWKIYESYDAIYQSGLADHILQYCSTDYNRLIRMMERTLSYANLRELIDTFAQVQPKNINQALEEFKRFREGATPEMLHDMADILRLNDPSLYQLKESMVDSVEEQLERIDKKEKIETGGQPV